MKSYLIPALCLLAFCPGAYARPQESPVSASRGVSPLATDSGARRAEIYRDARAAIGAAKVRAAKASPANRKSVLARETEARLGSVAKKWSIDRVELERIITAGELADGRAARKTEVSAKTTAKARVQAEMNAALAPPPLLPAPIPSGLSPADRKAVLRATGVIPPKPARP